MGRGPSDVITRAISSKAATPEAPALAPVPAVGSLGGDDLDVPVAAPPAVGTLTGTLGEDDDYEEPLF